MGVTLRQIAERIGCSRSTVSYALRNSPHISPEMRRKIQTVAREMGWKPNPELNRQMALVRKASLGATLPPLAVVVNKKADLLEVEPASRLQMEGAIEYAESLGFTVNVFNIAEQPLSPTRLNDILKARGIEGVIFIATLLPDLPLEFLTLGKDFASVVSGIRYPQMPFHVAIPDLVAAGRMAVQEVLKLGYKRPSAFIPELLDEPLHYSFGGGVSTGLMDVPEEDRLPVRYMPGLDEQAYADSATWVRERNSDAIICLDVNRCQVLRRRLEEDGVHLPLFSLDWYPHLDVEGGVDLMQKVVGRAAVDIVVTQLNAGEKGIPDVQLAVNVEGVWASRA